MKKSHKRMDVTAGEFNALVEDLVKTLDKFNVPDQEKKELLGALAGLRGDIVENESSATGGSCREVQTGSAYRRQERQEAEDQG